MPINFPDSPSVSDSFTSGERTWIWNGVTWDSDTAGNIAWDSVTEKPTEFTPVAHDHTKSEITDFAHNHVMADITDYEEPVIPEVTFSNTFMMMGA
jgi:hypothetical protein